jgi:hypothetical protein
MIKPNKENLITEILFLLQKGSTYTETKKVILSKFKLTEVTFVSYWKESNERHSKIQLATQTAIVEQSINADLDRLKLNILTKTDALLILTDIAKENLKESVNGSISAKLEQISAIKTIAELQGWNEAIKSDVTTNGNLVHRITFKKNNEL